MIEAKNLHKSFGSVVAVDDVSFTAPDGSVTGLLGPNGAGKTTTLRMLYALLQPDRGEALIDGYKAADQREQVLSRVGVLSDNKGLYPRLTARENIRYFGRLHELPTVELEARINNLIDLLEMQDFADRRAEGFSQGQRTKVAIARALVHNPQNIMLDEPTNGLDVMSTRSMRSFIRRLRDEGKCVLFSSHIMQEVSALCDNIVVIAHGKVSAEGTADELLRLTGQSNLEDAFVAAIGSGEGLAQ